MAGSIRSLTVRVSVSAGTDIEQAAKDAIRLSARIGVAVEFDFNGVLVLVGGSDDHAETARRWRRALERGASVAY